MEVKTKQFYRMKYSMPNSSAKVNSCLFDFDQVAGVHRSLRENHGYDFEITVTKVTHIEEELDLDLTPVHQTPEYRNMIKRLFIDGSQRTGGFENTPDYYYLENLVMDEMFVQPDLKMNPMANPELIFDYANGLKLYEVEVATLKKPLYYYTCTGPIRANVVVLQLYVRDNKVNALHLVPGDDRS